MGVPSASATASATAAATGPRHAQGPGFLVRRLHQVSLSIFHDHLQPLAITPLQTTVLLVLQDEDGLEQVTVAARARVDTSTVKDVVTRLEAKGLLRREPGTEDRRTRRMFLSDAGRETLERAEEEARRASQVLLAPLKAAERKLFLGMIAKVVRAHEEAHATHADAPWRRSRAPQE